MRKQMTEWRKTNRLTQVEAAEFLGISQTYLSLMEKGTRPVTAKVRERLETAGGLPLQEANRNAELSALGYPGFAHVVPSRLRPAADAWVLSLLKEADADARVVEALPWVLRRYASQMDIAWIVRQAKLANQQNRLGFLLELAAVPDGGELAKARLLAESTMCWDSMPQPTRVWLRQNRSPLAEFWNVVTTMGRRDE